MDLSLAPDSFGSGYVHQHHHLQQQQQNQPQQQQQQQRQQQQEQQQRHLHYAYQHAQHHQALSLAPPSGKSFYDLESLEYTGASSSLGLGNLAASSSYQKDYDLYAPWAAPPSSLTAAVLTSHHSLMPSHSHGQLWSRNSNNLDPAYVGASQHLHYSPAQAAGTATRILHSSAYNSAIHPLGDAQAAQCSSLHAWATEPHGSQWSQHQWDNGLPPGVEPSSTPTTTSAFLPPTNVSLPRSQPHMHPSLHYLPPRWQPHVQPYQPLQQNVPLGVNVRTGQFPQKLRPRKNSVKEGAPRRVPLVKTTLMKVTGDSSGITSDKKGPGWCGVCERNCVTAVALKQHLEGKRHKKRVAQVALQNDRAEVATETVEEDGGVANMLEQVWMHVTMMGKLAQKTEKGKRRLKLKEEGKDAQYTDASKAEGGPIEVKMGHAKASNEKVVEMVRCDICNVECNSKAVLEFHLGGKKHASRLKKLQV